MGHLADRIRNAQCYVKSIENESPADPHSLNLNCSVILNTGRTLAKYSQNLSKQSNVLPVFSITEGKVLVQSVDVKQ